MPVSTPTEIPTVLPPSSYPTNYPSVRPTGVPSEGEWIADIDGFIKFDEYGTGCSLLDLDGINDSNIEQNAQFTISNWNFKENELSEVGIGLVIVFMY